jgi:hypothetical protein
MTSTPAAPIPSAALPVVRDKVRTMLLGSEAFRSLPSDKQQKIAHDTVEVMHYLSNPEGIADEKLKRAAAAMGAGLAAAQAAPNPAEFKAQAAREGAAAAKLYLDAVNFPQFVGGLITNVFHAIVTSSIEQMEAYGKLVADVAKTLNQFRDDNVTDNQGRDHLVDQYPDIFEISVDTGDDGSAQPRVRMKDGVDEDAAVKRLKDMPTEGGPVDALDDDTVENKLVPAARTQLATSRQQLLATMVLMGINRIVVTDGKIQAKVLFDFKAVDRFRNKTSATSFDYAKDQQGNLQMTTNTQEDIDTGSEGGSYSHSSGGQSGQSEDDYQGAHTWTKGTYKTQQQPVITLATASQSDTQADLSTKAQLSGLVDINFKSDYLPLEKMADSFQIANIQNAARPGQARPAAGAAAAAPAAGTAAGTAPAAGGGGASTTTTAPATAPATTPAR